MDPEFTCGNDLRFLEWWLIHHGKQSGEQGYNSVINNLAGLTQSIVQVLVSAQIPNAQLGQEFRSEAAKELTAAAQKLTAPRAVAVHA